MKNETNMKSLGQFWKVDFQWALVFVAHCCWINDGDNAGRMSQYLEEEVLVAIEMAVEKGTIPKFPRVTQAMNESDPYIGDLKC